MLTPQTHKPKRRKPVQIGMRGLYFDRVGREILSGDSVRIANSRGDKNEICTVTDDFKLIHPDGKFSSVTTWLDAIWWRNDEPENFITVLGR